MIIRSGHKTVTRRVITESQKKSIAWTMVKNGWCSAGRPIDPELPALVNFALGEEPQLDGGGLALYRKRCRLRRDVRKTMPYLPGEVYFLKEAWHTERVFDDLKPSELPPDAVIEFRGDFNTGDGYTHRLGHAVDRVVAGKFRSPLFLPAQFARDAVKAKTVGVAQVDGLTTAEIMSEGCTLDAACYSHLAFQK
ncbi:MAG: hypothetical protein ACYTAN_18270, partial [Planctomycetota bacterium]